MKKNLALVVILLGLFVCKDVSATDLITNLDVNTQNIAVSSSGESNSESIPVNKRILKRTLRLGSRGEDVKLIQALFGLKIDGLLGRGTVVKIKEWQKLNGLKPDGVFGKTSINKIYESRNNSTQNVSECNLLTSKNVKIISPKSGDVYTPGQKVTISWMTCNLKDSKVYLGLISGGHDLGHLNDTNPISASASSYQWTVPDASHWEDSNNLQIVIDDNTVDGFMSKSGVFSIK